MISNATLIRHQVRSVDMTGTPAYTPSSAIMARCALVSPTARDRAALGALLTDASSLLIVLLSQAAGRNFAPGDRLEIGLDETIGTTVHQITSAAREIKAGGLAHWSMILERVKEANL